MSSRLSLSEEISLALDLLGYKLPMVKWRRHCYKVVSNLVLQWTAQPPPSLQGFSLKPYLIGSKVEGTTVLYQSDEDYMVVCEGVLCSSFVRERDQNTENVSVNLITENVDPGYALLQKSPDKRSIKSSWLQKFLDIISLHHSDGREYVSSETLNILILETYRGLHEAAIQDRSLSSELSGYIEVKAAENPSEGGNYKLRLKNHRFTIDFVLAFPCINMEFLAKWTRRKRNYGWPTVDQIWKISRMSAYVVPKSSKKLEHRHLEFRICHTFGEIELMKSFNETQIKLYVLLKELFKSQFEPKHPDIITSYVLKNVMFWLCENTARELFTLDLLIERFGDALMYIRRSVSDGGAIQNYFIPERNLLDGLLSQENRFSILGLLSEWISEGDNVVFRIDNVCRGVEFVRQDIVKTLLTVYFRNLCEIYYLKRRRFDLENGAARLAIFYMSDAAYKYLEKCFRATL